MKKMNMALIPLFVMTAGVLLYSEKNCSCRRASHG